MMRKIIIGLLLVGLACGGSLAYADSTDKTLTDADLVKIRANCMATQATLNRIHESDALARINLGQQYETISTKLMAPMNSRVALNRLDSVDLMKTTVAFNDKLNEFRLLYQQYEQTLSRAIELKCVDQPVAFYDTLTLARSHRAAVREAVVEMSDLTTQYGKQVKALQSSLEESN